MSKLEQIIAKVWKIRAGRDARQHAATIIEAAIEEAVRIRTAEIIAHLKADMIEDWHLNHMDAVDLITSNYSH